jgi:GT2 family glycosyltransferase
MDHPRIRCVVPTLNSAKTLDTTLLSLRSQRDVEVDVIVVDSGSTDGTLDICSRWNVPSIFVPKGNMYRAVNAGLRGSDAPWLTYLNSDDWLYADAYCRLLAHAQSTEADLVYGNCDYTDAEGRFAYSFRAASPGALPKLFSAGLQGFAQPAAVFCRRLYEQLDGFDEEYRFSGDAHFFARATLTSARLGLLPGAPVVCFRLHQQQFTQTRKTEIMAENQRIRELFQGANRPAAWLTSTRWRLSNLPNYAIRILRETVLAQRFRLPRSIDAFAHR